MTARRSTVATPASERIDARIAELGDWRGELLARLRALIREADPEGVEEWKWRGTPVWSHDGIVCTGEAYRSRQTHGANSKGGKPSGGSGQADWSATENRHLRGQPGNSCSRA